MNELNLKRIALKDENFQFFDNHIEADKHFTTSKEISVIIGLDLLSHFNYIKSNQAVTTNRLHLSITSTKLGVAFGGHIDENRDSFEKGRIDPIKIYNSTNSVKYIQNF